MRPSVVVRFALLATLAFMAASAEAAAWTPAGVAIYEEAGTHRFVRAVSDARGGFIAAWVDSGSTPARIVCQRVDSTGVARWGVPTGLTVVEEPGLPTEFATAPDGVGGVLLTWPMTRVIPRLQHAVYVQRIDANGTAVWVSGGVTTDTLNQSVRHSLSVAPDNSGGAIVAWVDDRNGDDIAYTQRVLSNGTRAWGAGVSLDSRINSNWGTALLADGAGGAFVSRGWGSGATDRYFQHVDAVGAKQWGTNGIAPLPSPSIGALMARIPGGDSLMIVWPSTGPTRVYGAWIQNATGTFVPTNGIVVQQNTTAVPAGLVVRPDRTSLVVTYTSSQIYCFSLQENVAPSGSIATVASAQSLDVNSNVNVTPDGSGGLFVVWSSAGRVYANHVTAACTVDWPAPVALAAGVSSSQTRPVGVLGADLLAAWTDDRNSATSGVDLYAQRVSPSGVTGSYQRILGAVAGGNGTFSQGGGRTWVRSGDSLQVRFSGTAGDHVDHVTVGGTNLGPVPNYTFRNVSGDSTLQAFFSNAAVTQQVAVQAGKFRPFSIPFALANAAVSSAFANLMPYDISRWRLFHWDAGLASYAEPSGSLTDVLPGSGYWFIARKDTTLSFTGATVPEALFAMPLRGSGSGQGWKQFGSPFRFPVAVSQLRLSLAPAVPITDVANTFTDHAILEWNTSTEAYAPAAVLLPGRAYWLWRNTASSVDLRFPFEWNPVAVGAAAASLAAGADWSIGVTARSGERESPLVFGTAPVAAGRWNGFSTHAAPAAPGAGLTLVARVSDWGEDNGEYRSVFRPDAGTLAWEFDASGAEGLAEAVLTFGFDRVPAGRRVLLSEPAAGWSREVTGGARVPLVLSGTPRRMRLEVVADGAPVTAPAPATALRAVGPNPFRDATTLAFSLARSGRLRWEVFDLAGRRVMAETRALEAGEHVVTWDGRDAAGSRVRPGLYLMRWQADGRAGSARLVRTE